MSIHAFTVYMLIIRIKLHVLNNIVKHIEDNRQTANTDMNIFFYLHRPKKSHNNNSLLSIIEYHQRAYRQDMLTSSVIRNGEKLACLGGMIFDTL